MKVALYAVGVFGNYQTKITMICISLGSIPFILSIAYSYLTRLPEFLCKNEAGEYIPCSYDRQ